MTRFDAKFTAYERAMNANGNFGLQGEAVGEQYGRYCTGLQYDEMKAANRAQGRENARRIAAENKFLQPKPADKAELSKLREAMISGTGTPIGDNFTPISVSPVEQPALQEGQEAVDAQKSYRNARKEMQRAEKEVKQHKAAMREQERIIKEIETKRTALKAKLKKAGSLSEATGLLKELKQLRGEKIAAKKALKQVIRSYNGSAIKFNGLLKAAQTAYNNLLAISEKANGWAGYRGNRIMDKKALSEIKPPKKNIKLPSMKAGLLSKIGKPAFAFGAIAAIAGLGMLAYNAFFKDDEVETLPETVDKNSASAVPVAPADTVAEEVVPTVTAVPTDSVATPPAATAESEVVGETDGAETESEEPTAVSAPEGEEAELVDEAAVEEEIAAEETEPLYEVQKGDCLWNICKKELKEKNGKEPKGDEIIKRIGEVMDKNGLHWEADHYHVMIYPKQKLNM